MTSDPDNSPSITIALQSTRPKFLALTLSCIFLAIVSCHTGLDNISITLIILLITGALSAHISVNAFNEYLDFKSGLDALTKRTPFSGGSGALIFSPASSKQVLLIAIGSLLVTMFIGFYFILSTNFMILPVGLLGIFIILTYTTWLNRLPLICLIAPGLAFGPLMIFGTHLIIDSQISVTTILVSLIPFFLTNNLLLVNQIPDIEADKRVGRNHFPISYGVKKSIYVYGITVLLTFLTLLAGYYFSLLSLWSLLAFIPLTAAIICFIGLLKFAHSIERLLPYMALNVIAALLTPVVFGFSFIINTGIT
jgi:1,4-dihydroxy-2-naphthoate octaprenyltransferase